MKAPRLKIPSALQLTLIDLINMGRQGASLSDVRQKMSEFVDVDLIRECAVCDSIFFAGRKNIEGCNSQHSAIIRKRRFNLKHKSLPSISLSA